MPPTQLKQVERLARKENRTLSELVREALRQYQQKQESPVNTELIAALRAVQEDARRSGLDKLPQRAINAEVLAHRREQRQKKLKQPVR
jgi:Arc/MetJ-type ribon-helix-helix transcriptional regulator